MRAAAIAATIAIASTLAPAAVRADERGAATATTAAVATESVFRAKKQLYLDAKRDGGAAAEQARARRGRELARRVGKKPAPVVNIYNNWTKEFLVLDATPKVELRDEALDRFFRCHFTNQPTRMDRRLLELLVQAAVKFKASRINIVSGFRAPKYNLVLRKKGHEVARESQHTMGRAVDFRIPGVPVKRVHAWVRSLKLGGVGIYRSSEFVHADTGPIRYWAGR
jgi:uncharacterized protein YcbK (DUF882 family)